MTFDKIRCLQNYKLKKWHVEKITSRLNEILTKWETDKIAWLTKWQVVQMAKRQLKGLDIELEIPFHVLLFQDGIWW